MSNLKKLGTATVAVAMSVALASSVAGEAAAYTRSQYPAPVMKYVKHPAGFADSTEVRNVGGRLVCNIPTATATSTNGAKAVVRKELQPLIQELMRRTEAKGYRLRAADTGGFNCRFIKRNGVQVPSLGPSNHAYGRAVDLNWQSNPQSSVFKSNIPPAVVKMWMDHGFYWGGHYAYPNYDTMHFEYVGSKANIGYYYKKLTGKPTPTPTPTPTPPGETNFVTLKQGSTNKGAVTTLQLNLRARGYKIAADGIFGTGTKNAVINFQRSKGLVADGIAGAKTWAALVPTLKEGARGDAVKALQLELRASGHNITADGIFGASTKAAVIRHQKAERLVADGISGPKTWGSLVD